MYLNAATLRFESNAQLRAFNNTAVAYGGVVYYEDTPTSAQCNFINDHGTTNEFLPGCFLQGSLYPNSIDSIHNSAKKGGDFLYGGMLNKCRPYRSTTLSTPPDLIEYLSEVCACEERLQVHNVDCTIDESIRITKKNTSNFWMGAVVTQNGSHGGLILYESCPVEYCKTQAVVLTLEDLDAQCALNRTGMLCGKCASNYSLMLGSSRCEICSDHHLALLLAFAAAGLALVAFLTFLKLTVATGTLNSVILYANVIQVNRRLFFPPNQVNILTVCTAWLNLDLGIETCFYDGLTAYVQTWLQFAFPVYVWVLIGSIILTARYSVLLSRLIGSNPIAMLATLLLMSYTKILRIIIEVYSSVDLDYPNEETVRVWLKDGNILYLGPQHLSLVVVTSLVLVFLFLPYTLLLLLGHRLYPFTGRKWFFWFSRIKPLLESYYAPHKPRTRYWTGFLLLVRCALYIVFSFNSLGGTKKSLLAIVLAFTVLAILGSGRIYKSTITNVVEMFVYFNLVFLSAATLAEYTCPALVYCLVGTVLAGHSVPVPPPLHCKDCTVVEAEEKAVFSFPTP